MLTCLNVLGTTVDSVTIVVVSPRSGKPSGFIIKVKPRTVDDVK